MYVCNDHAQLRQLRGMITRHALCTISVSMHRNRIAHARAHTHKSRANGKRDDVESIYEIGVSTTHQTLMRMAAVPPAHIADGVKQLRQRRFHICVLAVSRHEEQTQTDDCEGKLKDSDGQRLDQR